MLPVGSAFPGPSTQVGGYSKSAVLLLLLACVNTDGFAFTTTTVTRQTGTEHAMPVRMSTPAGIDTDTSPAIPTTTAPKTKKLGLLTFDLDDTLYPIAPVLDEANAAFASAMQRFGYEHIQPSDIVETAKRIRSELAERDPEAAAVLTHTEIRILAIREEMESYILEKKLKDTAEDWATQVEHLSKVVVESAKKWAKAAVPASVVQAVYTAWEMERYHAAERLLYPEVLDVFERIKKDNPGVIIGAVTDGRANPLLMTFTLAQYFDFCVSWEDDQGKRSQFFKELSNVEGNAELTWIYDAAKEKYRVLSESAAEVNKAAALGEIKELLDPLDFKNVCWIHVGDDLAYDVGGSAACGAKTILVELLESYGQTARKRFGTGIVPGWSTSSKDELENRQGMNEAAEKFVDARIDKLTLLPEVIQNILEEEA